MFILRRCSGKGAFEAIPKKNLKLDFSEVKKKFEVVMYTPVVILIKIKDCEVSCFKNGKLLIKNCKNKKEAEALANEIYSRF